MRWDDFMKGDDGNAEFGVVCCADREEKRRDGKGGGFTGKEA